MSRAPYLSVSKNREQALCLITTRVTTMSVLSHDEILKAIDAGEIKISPYKPDAVGAASVDLTLANEFRLFNPGHQPLDVTETTDYRDITEHVVLPEGEPLLLSPGQACLGITEEHITLSPGICGLLGMY